jgi:hypothetical protein
LEVKSRGLTPELLSKLTGLRVIEDGGIPSVEVKFLDIRRNTGGEGGHLGHI